MQNTTEFNFSKDDLDFCKKIKSFLDMANEKDTIKYSTFMNQRQIQLAKSVCKNKLDATLFWGGYNKADRVLLGISASYKKITEDDFPIQCLSLKFNPKYELRHRDFLGAIMNLNIVRDFIGDIVISQGLAVVFVVDHIAEILKTELVKVGNVGVKVEESTCVNFENHNQMITVSTSVSSLRLDCVVAALINLSREASARMIKSKLVILNYNIVISTSKNISDGDTISIKGYGKFLIALKKETTKKGKLKIMYHKYI